MPPASLGGGAKPEVEVHFHHVQMYVKWLLDPCACPV